MTARVDGPVQVFTAQDAAGRTAELVHWRIGLGPVSCSRWTDGRWKWWAG
ncbi:hypothetical protein ACF09K_01815 [Streptomyces sp. NPDC014882]